MSLYNLRSFLISATLIVFCFSLTLGCCKLHGRAHSAKKVEYFVKHLSRKLELNVEQKAIIEKIKNEFLQKKKAYRESIAPLKKKIVEDIRKAKLSKGTLEKFSQKRELQRKAMDAFLLDKLLLFQGSLSAKQNQALAEELEKSGKGPHRWFRH